MSDKIIDKLQSAVNNERLRRDLLELLDEEPFTRLREWADSLTTIADAVDTVRDAIEAWAECEEREDRASLKDEALSSIEDMINEWNASPLDVGKLEDFDPEDED